MTLSSLSSLHSVDEFDNTPPCTRVLLRRMFSSDEGGKKDQDDWTEMVLRSFAYMTTVNFVLVVLSCVVLPVLRRVVDPLLSSAYVMLGAFLLVPWRRLRLRSDTIDCVSSSGVTLVVLHSVFHVMPLIVAAVWYGREYRVRPVPFLGTLLIVVGHALLFDYGYRYHGHRHRRTSPLRGGSWTVLTGADSAMYARGLLVFCIGVALATAWAVFLVSFF